MSTLAPAPRRPVVLLVDRAQTVVGDVVAPAAVADEAEAQEATADEATAAAAAFTSRHAGMCPISPKNSFFLAQAEKH